LDGVWGRSSQPRRLPPDGAAKIVEFTDVETVLFLPDGEITEIDPRELPVLLDRQAVARGCPYCGASLGHLFVFRRGLWPAGQAGEVANSAPPCRAICQECGHRSSLSGEQLMGQ